MGTWGRAQGPQAAWMRQESFIVREFGETRDAQEQNQAHETARRPLAEGKEERKWVGSDHRNSYFPRLIAALNVWSLPFGSTSGRSLQISSPRPRVDF